MSGLLVGVDGSASSERALRWALEEGEARSVPVTVLIVRSYDPIPLIVPGDVYVPSTQDELKASRTLAEELLAKAVADLGHAPAVDVHVEARSGHPAATLLEASQSADHVVVGSRGAGGFGRLLLGSVSSQLVHHARCPVTVVPSQRD